MKRPARSDHYQFKILETHLSDDILASFDNSKSFYSLVNPFKYNEELFELKAKLFNKIMLIVDNKLTQRQKQVIHLYYIDNMTQMEAAEELNVNQSSITKTLFGNVDYRDGKGNAYGGCMKKIRRIAMADPEIVETLKRIEELNNE